jgi:predicted PhzF superfamily epimerase YddE/YHI9
MRHATLACAYVLFEILQFQEKENKIQCKSGILKISKQEKRLVMDFPSWKPELLDDYPGILSTILGDVQIVQFISTGTAGRTNK